MIPYPWNYNEYLGDFSDFVESLQTETNGKVVRCEFLLLQAQVRNRMITLDLLKEGTAETERRVWTVACQKPLCYRLQHTVIGSGERVTVGCSQTHPLVWEQTDPCRRLGFRGRPTDGQAAVLALYEAHFNLAGDWIACPFVTDWKAALQILEQGYGVLTSGPERLLLAYAEAMRPFGVDAYLMPEQDHNRIPSEVRPEIWAVTLNDSFIVGLDFSAQCVTELLLL